jgi:hypothetical protein
MNSNDHLTDDEIIEDGPTREELLMRATAPAGRKLGTLTLRPLTSETFTYLWHVKNFFLKGLFGDSEVSPQNANPVWSTAEFVYIHAGDEDEVADSVWDTNAFRSNVRAFLRGPLNDPQILTAALPIIEAIVREYFAAQNKVMKGKGGAGAGGATPGKKQARAGRRPI